MSGHGPNNGDHVPVTAADVTDAKLLARRFELSLEQQRTTNDLLISGQNSLRGDVSELRESIERVEGLITKVLAAQVAQGKRETRAREETRTHERAAKIKRKAR